MSLPQTPGPDSTRRVISWLMRGSLGMSAASGFGAGVVGAVTLSLFGPDLAMGAAIYGGNTEPNRPDLPYPWFFFTLGCAMCLGGLVLLRKGDTARLVLSSALIGLGDLVLVILPFAQLYRLVGLT